MNDKISEELLKIAKELVSEDSNPLNGMSKNKAKKFIHKILERNSRGSFKDDNWRSVWKIFKDLENADIEWVSTGTKYVKNSQGVANAKRWDFEIYFEDERGKERELTGVLNAHGAGFADDPFSRYDIAVYITN